MNLSTSDQVALVTGSARRIGAEIVRKLHAEGMHVILHYNGSRNAAKSLADELNSQRGSSVTPISFDLLKFDQLPTFVERLSE